MVLGSDDVFDAFLSQRGHRTDPDAVGWKRDHKKKQCPECGGLHDAAATECSVCGWTPNKT